MSNAVTTSGHTRDWSWCSLLSFINLQEMTLDEYEAMMAEKQPKVNKEASKPKVNTRTMPACAVGVHRVRC